MRAVSVLSLLLPVLLPLVAFSGVTPTGVDFTTKKGDAVGQKRFEKKLWGGGNASSLSGKRFHIEEWDKHYSSVGTKRASIAVKEGEEKKMFRSSTKRFPEKTYEMSRWNQEVADLQERARIQTDQRAMKIAEHRAYEAAVQDAEPYAETGEEVSLRDINRYQFRRNRPEGEVPVRRAGEGQ